MKKVMSLIAGATLLASAAYPCTRVLWNDKDQPVIIGRTMDWAEDMGTHLWVLPRGIARHGSADRNPLKWTSKHGSIIATAHDMSTTDGINEAGLNASVLWLAESNYGRRDEGVPGLGVTIWTQFFLDNFATVDAAVKFVKANPFQIIGLEYLGSQAALHLSLADAQGDSAIIEYVDGKPTIYHGRSHKVMTNSPLYSKQLANLAQHHGFGGMKSLPGTGSPMDRFVRAHYYLRELSEPKNGREAYAGMNSIMRNVSQPFGAKNAEATIWRTITDLTNGRYYFESTLSLNVIWMDLKSFDFSTGAPTLKLDLAADLDRSGDVSADFVATQPFQFLLK